MAYIEMVHSFKRYHMGNITITANNDVSFGIERGELAIILGSSGAGKSTVLNILGGMDTNSEGKVIIDGVDISDFNAKQLTDYRRNNIGFVFQFYNLVANLTAKENVELASELVKNAADPVQTLVDVGLGGRGPAGHGASATGLGQRVGRLRTDATAGGTDATGSRTEPALRFMEPAGERQNAAGRGARTTRNKQNRARQSRRDARQMGTDRHHRQTLRTNTRQIRHGDQPVQRSLRRIQQTAERLQCGTATIPERRSAARPRLAGVSEQCGQSRTGIQTDSRKTKRARQSGVAGRQASRRRRHAAYPRPEGHRQGRNGIPEQTRRIQRAEARSRTQDIRSRTADNPRRGEDRQSHRPGLFRQRPPRRPDLARLPRVHGHRRHRGGTGGHLPDLPLLRRGARHLQHHGTHGGRGTHQFRNVEGARLRQRGCDAQIHRIRIRRIHPGHMHRRARRPHAAAAYRRPRIQRGIHHAGHHAQIPPLDHHGRIRTRMDKRRRAGMAGRVQGTARKTGEPTAAQAAGQRLENSFGTFPTTMEPSEFHTQSDRP